MIKSCPPFFAHFFPLQKHDIGGGSSEGGGRGGRGRGGRGRGEIGTGFPSVDFLICFTQNTTLILWIMDDTREQKTCKDW